jgi:NDP-sugar pyrophosphorylase family protein
MKAMVLSAGYGTRLGDLTREMPKPMLRLQERPMLEYIIRHLAWHGFDQIAVNLHFMPDVLQNYFGDGSFLGVKLIYSYEPELLGTAGGIKKMAGFLGDEEVFMAHYGDVLTDQDFTAMLHFHYQKHALATLLLHQSVSSNSVVSLDEEGRIVGFLERPTEEARHRVKSPWVNSGICLCSSGLLAEIPSATTCDLPRDIFTKLVDGGRLFGFPLSGYRCAVDSPARLAEARSAIAEGRCQIQGRRGC